MKVIILLGFGQSFEILDSCLTLVQTEPYGKSRLTTGLIKTH
ncbi:MAG: hypothetical protein ACI8P3_003299 [Saprospiraceae bacterium]|jgi:hypothetical protein